MMDSSDTRTFPNPSYFEEKSELELEQMAALGGHRDSDNSYSKRIIHNINSNYSQSATLSTKAKDRYKINNLQFNNNFHNNSELMDDNASEDSKLDRSIFFDKLLVDESDNYRNEVSHSEL